MYNANRLSTTLDWLRFVLYTQKMKKSSSSFQLESLPPTSAAAKYHAYRAYFAVQEWLGNARSLQPTDWGWELHDGMLTPILTDKPLASGHVLGMVSCGCESGCGMKCTCRKAGLNCTVMCSTCIGKICTNACPSESDGNDE